MPYFGDIIAERNKRFLLFLIQQVSRGCPWKNVFFAYVVSQKKENFREKTRRTLSNTPKPGADQKKIRKRGPSPPPSPHPLNEYFTFQDMQHTALWTYS